MTGPETVGFSTYLDRLGNLGIEPSLSGIKALCLELDQPQNACDAIQVTGTNGKTSTARMTQALLSAHGLKCGLYTSPHLESYHERISVDGVEISADEFDDMGRLVSEKVKAAEQSLSPRRITQFEVLTATALAYFARLKVEAAVLEVGMGGRWDATSIAVPKVAAITNVTMDHADWLGPELTDIAAEKSYVIREGNTVVIGEAPTAVREVFETRAAGQKSTLIPLALSGSWREKNSQLAIAVAKAYLKRELVDDVARGIIAGVSVPGRAEIISGSPDIFLDGAHNQAGIDNLTDCLGAEFSGRRLVLLVSILKDKAVPEMVEELCRISRDIIFTTSKNPRCLEPGELKKLAAGLGVQADAVFDVGQGLVQAKVKAGSDGVVVVTGSLYLVGEVRKLLVNQDLIFP